MFSNLAGQHVTKVNAGRIAARMRRCRDINIALGKHDSAIPFDEEALTIDMLLLEGLLPEGRPEAQEPQVQPLAKPAPPAPTLYNCLYIALSGRKPPEVPHNARFTGPKALGQDFFLAPNGSLRQGLSPSRSCALPKAKLLELVEEGRRLLASPKAVASLQDVRNLF